MATISSGVGLFSGLDYVSLVDQLMQIEARPRDQLKVRMSNIDAQRTALVDITARISALLGRVGKLTKPSFFQATKGASSNPDVMSITTADNARPGTYSFTVRSLATTHQLVSRGFTRLDAPVSAGSFSLESAQAKVNRETRLEELNGFAGVQRGTFKLIDGQGTEATIDIGDAQTIADVIDRINSATVGVQADFLGESIVLRDTTGGTEGVRIREIGDGQTAADLGFSVGNTYAADGQLVGENVMFLAETTPLSYLNDGLGVRRLEAGTDFTITSANPALPDPINVRLGENLQDGTRLERLNHGTGVELGQLRVTTKDGNTTEVDLSDARTVGDVRQKLEQEVDNITVTLTGGRLTITDSTGGAGPLVIQDMQGHAARDLGIAAESETNAIGGRQVLFVDTLGDVLAAINYAENNDDGNGNPVVQASISNDGKRIVLTDTSGGTGPGMQIAAANGSNALDDLGIAAGIHGSPGDPAEAVGARIIGGMDSVLLKTLNGGAGFEAGVINISANGQSVDVDLSGAETLRDVIERINQASQDSGPQGLRVEAGYDSTGKRLRLINLAEDGSTISISDVSGSFANDLGLNTPGVRITSSDLQRQYISGTTRLDDLNFGQGVALGKMQITDSRGMTAEVDLAIEHAETLQDVIDAINDLDAVAVEARINDTGDGLLLVDQADGDGDLTISEVGGSAARDLNILGTSDGDPRQVNGSFQFDIDTSGGDTLEDLVTKINATNLAAAHVINDGSPVSPYRLSITSQASGRAGALVIDDRDSNLQFTTLTRAQDAAVFLGDSANSGVMVTSSTNTISDVIDGVTLNLTGVDDQPVTVTVNRDLENMVATLRGLVEDFNGAMRRIDEATSYDSETEKMGILFANSTLRTAETRLFRAFTGTVPGANGPINRLSDVGLKYSDGKLNFDEAKFREVFSQDPEAVNEFFTHAEKGLAHDLKEELERMTQTGGLIKREDKTLESQKELLADRVARLNDLLESKRQRLLREFQMMEQALGELQSQQNALNNMSTGGGSAATMGYGM